MSWTHVHYKLKCVSCQIATHGCHHNIHRRKHYQIPTTNYVCTLCDSTCENIWNLGMQDKSSIIDWHSSFTDILFLLKTVTHNIPSSNWIIQRGRVIWNMEVRQISCYHTNLADASTPSKICDSHNGDYELCCRFWDVTLCIVVEDPDASIFKFRPWRWKPRFHPKRCYISTGITTSHSTNTHLPNLC